MSSQQKRKSQALQTLAAALERVVDGEPLPVSCAELLQELRPRRATSKAALLTFAAGHLDELSRAAVLGLARWAVQDFVAICREDPCARGHALRAFGRVLLRLERPVFDAFLPWAVRRLEYTLWTVLQGVWRGEHERDLLEPEFDEFFKGHRGLLKNWRWLELCSALHALLANVLPNSRFPCLRRIAALHRVRRVEPTAAIAATHRLLPHAKAELTAIVASFL